MSDPRERLAEIERRAGDAVKLAAGLRYQLVEQVSQSDVPRLVSALRAVLAWEPCQGADEVHADHMRTCVPFYEARAALIADALAGAS